MPAAIRSGRAEDAAPIPAIADDGSLYPIGKFEAHRLGIRHLAVSAFLFSGDRLLIQQRAQDKYHCGGLWANTCCTHPHWGEKPHTAVLRRLREELGICPGPDLEPSGTLDYRVEVGNDLIENERVSLFFGAVDAATLTLTPAPAEVRATRWIAMDALRHEIDRAPEHFAPWFRIYFERGVIAPAGTGTDRASKPRRAV